MARKYTLRSKEEKLAIVKTVLSGTPAQEYENKGIADHHAVMNWVRKYQKDGEAGLETTRKHGNPLARYSRRKELTCGERRLKDRSWQLCPLFQLRPSCEKTQ